MWRYAFEGIADLAAYASDYRDATNEAADCWIIYVISTYELDAEIHDNDPDNEVTGDGTNYGTEPEYAFCSWEISRDLGAEHGWTTAQVEHCRKGCALHEVGHQFGLDHSGLPNDVMFACGTNAEEDEYKDLPLVFSPAHIARIQDTSYP